MTGWNVGWYLQRLPVMGLLCYTCYAWRYILSIVTATSILYLTSKNLMAILTDTEKLPRSAFLTLMFLDLWVGLGTIFDMLSIDQCYTRAILDTILARSCKPCPTTNLKIEKVNEDCQVYVYKPAKITNKGCLLYIHGGGFCYLSAYSFSSSISWMAHYLEMIVVSVEYRLAPEHPFPAALTDCYNSLQWVYDTAESLSIDTSQVFISGDSAGGNLSAALCLLHKERKGAPLTGEKTNPPLAGQILIYPMLQGFTSQSPSRLDNSAYFPRPDQTASVSSMYAVGTQQVEKLVGDPEKMVAGKIPKFWWVVNGADKDLEVEEAVLDECRILEPMKGASPAKIFGNSYIFPLHATDLSKLPPAYIVVAKADPLKDDGEWYATYLKYFGNEVDFVVAKNCHGFMTNYAKSTQAVEELMKIKDFINQIIKVK